MKHKFVPAKKLSIQDRIQNSDGNKLIRYAGRIVMGWAYLGAWYLDPESNDVIYQFNQWNPIEKEIHYKQFLSKAKKLIGIEEIKSAIDGVSIDNVCEVMRRVITRTWEIQQEERVA